MAQGNFVILDDRGILAVSGPDRRAFLQGLVSNDVEKIAADRAVYAALLTAQGKYLHDFIMTAAGEAIWLDAEAARLADLKRRLSIYRLRAKVTLDELPDLAVAAVFGDGVCGVLDLPEQPGAARPFAGGVALADPRLMALGARVILPRQEIRETLIAAGIAEADFAAYDRHRLALGIPDGSRDLLVEKSILLESGFDELNGVDWQKGCYIGQELTARTKYRGLIKKRLFPVRIEGPGPAPGTIVTLEGKEAGEMRSSRDGLGLALLRLDAVAEARSLSVGATQLVPLHPEWMRLEVENPSPAPREREGPAPAGAGG
jgi:folate-binding protein YgfZ